MKDLVPGPVRRAIRAARAARGDSAGWDADDADHPERLAVLAHARGPRVIEIGCGPRKSAPGYIGIDLTPGGQPGSVGSARGRLSQADVAASGDRLPLPDASVDSVVARHNLEHYIDLVSVLREWARVVRPGGALVVVVPDDASFDGRTVLLDDTHMHAFTQESLAALLPLVGWDVELVAPCVPGWSFLAVARRHGARGS